MKQRISLIFGKPFAEKLYEFEFSNDNFTIEGFISKEILSGSKFNKNKSVLFYFLNNRYISKIKKLDNIILSIYKQYNHESNPVRIINLNIRNGNYDINVGEAKDKYFIENENEIVSFFNEKLLQFHEEKLKLYWVTCMKEYNNNSTNKKDKIVFSNSVVSNSILEKVNNKVNSNVQSSRNSCFSDEKNQDQEKNNIKENSIKDDSEKEMTNSNIEKKEIEKPKRSRIDMESLILKEAKKEGKLEKNGQQQNQIFKYQTYDENSIGKQFKFDNYPTKIQINNKHELVFGKNVIIDFNYFNKFFIFI